ncbi:MAG: M67 family metallopeptidase [Anaerolineae bacterium]|jgi:proteasome lid subunit RPN8/RPN11
MDPTSEGLVLTAEVVAALVTHARSEAPNEACGLLGGRDGQVERIYPLPNTESSPARYLAEPEAQVRAMMDIEERGWEIVAIYHSHPDGPAHPSAIDVEMAFYPDSPSLIISLANREQPELRAFRIREGRIEEVALRIEERGESSKLESETEG